MNMLEQIILAKEKEISELKTNTNSSLPGLKTNSFISQIKKNKINFICEIKPKSPTQEVVCSYEKIDTCITAYNNYGSAISVLTDKKYFGGGYELLRRVRNSTNLPILQKDFILDTKQIDLGYASGASAILLIVKILTLKSLTYLIEHANCLNLSPVVEINDEDELNTAVNCGAKIILINNRNLDSLKVDLNTTKSLAPLIPKDIISISASGYSRVEEIEDARDFVDAFLIGTALMKSKNPNSRLEKYLGESKVIV